MPNVRNGRINNDKKQSLPNLKSKGRKNSRSIHDNFILKIENK